MFGYEKYIVRDYPIGRETFFGVGGRAEALFEPDSVEVLSGFLKQFNKPFVVIGQCSNVLIRDGGIDGIVIRMRRMNGISHKEGLLIADGGCVNSAIVGYAEENFLGGLEFLAGIPGSVGAGVKMNAGCFGSEFKDVVESVEIVDSKGGVSTKNAHEIGFTYRGSAVENDQIVTKVVMRTTPSDGGAIRAKTKEILTIKRAMQPFGKTCGSTFKNGDDYYAAKLLDEAGLKGYRIGGAYISEKHANFIMNDGTATAADIEALIRHMYGQVKKKFDINLALEIKIFGKGL